MFSAGVFGLCLGIFSFFAWMWISILYVPYIAWGTNIHRSSFVELRTMTTRQTQKTFYHARQSTQRPMLS